MNLLMALCQELALEEYVDVFKGRIGTWLNLI